MSPSGLWPTLPSSMFAEQRPRSRAIVLVQSRRHGCGRSCCFQNSQRCRAVAHFLCFQRNFLLTANARFQFPHQSVTAPRRDEGCYYCKQWPCCFIWLPEACRASPDLCGFIVQEWGISSFSNENTSSRLVYEFENDFFFFQSKGLSVWECHQSSVLFQQQRGWTRKSPKPEQKNEAEGTLLRHQLQAN